MNTPANQPGVSDGDVRAFGSGLDLAAAKFSLSNARLLAVLAQMAYADAPTIQDQKTDTQVLIRDLGDCIVVAFRGTSSLRDFVTDANCRRSPFGVCAGRVHDGALGAYLAIWPALKNWLLLNGVTPGAKPIIFIGHSLGGMLAMLAAKRACAELFKVHSVYTFGCPRVGDKQFQIAYNATAVPGSAFATLGEATFTIINDCDIVPRIPGWLAGFRRPGRDEFISDLDREKIVEDPHFIYRLESDIWALADSYRAKRSILFLDELLTDHHVEHYIEALDEIADVEVAA